MENLLDGNRSGSVMSNALIMQVESFTISGQCEGGMLHGDSEVSRRMVIESVSNPDAGRPQFSPVVGRSVQSYTVLMIEDSADYAQILAEVLELADQGTFHLNIESRLAAGLRKLAEGPYDVVLLDLGLPDSHGLQTLVSVATRVPRVPIIVLTAVEDGAMAFECLENGAYAYMVKGQVDPRSLSDLVIGAASDDPEMRPKRTETSGEPVGRMSNGTTDARVAAQPIRLQGSPDLYRGQVAIELESPGGVAQTAAFLNRIRNEPGLRVVLQTGSQRNTRLLVELIAPSPLKENISEMAGVSAVSDQGNSQRDAGLMVVLN